jgi:short-subunit dehydrogenase
MRTNAQPSPLPVAIITGATGGIGRHLVAQCLADGMRVVAIGRDEQALQELASTSDAVLTCRVDLLSDGAVDIVQAACERMGPTLQLLVNCAGAGLLTSFAGEAFEVQRDLSRLNFEAAAGVTHALLPRLIDGRGQVLNIASLAGLMPAANMAMLSASKAALMNWSLALRAELRGRIGVTAFCPGLTRTPFLARAKMTHLKLDAFAQEPERIARRALAAARRNRPIAYAGAIDSMMAAALRIAPADLLGRVAARVLSPAV